MDKKHRQLLNDNMFALVQNLTVDEILMSCSHNLFPGVGMRQSIMAKATNSEKAYEYIDKLQTRGPDAFDMFIKALLQSNQDHVAALLGYKQSTSRRQTPGTKGSGAIGESDLRKYIPGKGGHSGSGAVGMDDLEAGMGRVALREPAARTPLPDTWPLSGPELQRVQLVRLQASEETRKLDELRELVASKEAYPFTTEGANFKGEVIIISNSKGRLGTEHDENALEKLFEELSFRLTSLVDLSAEAMLSNLKRRAKKLKDIPILCVFILSHGNEDCVKGQDDKEVPVSDILQAFDSTNCPDMIGRPKLFFIQACRGSVQPVPYSQEQVDATPPAHGRMRGADKANPHLQDMGLYSPTLHGHVAARDTKLGSWFIQAVFWVFSNYAHRKNLHQLMLDVRKLVGKAKTKKGVTQTSDEWTTLQKEVYFFCPAK